MATNAVIRIEGLDSIEFYKHWDGHPEATLPWLETFNEEFTEKRGIDPSCKAAQLMRSSVRDAKQFKLDDSEYTGWRIDAKNSFFYNYLYILKEDGTVTFTTE